MPPAAARRRSPSIALFEWSCGWTAAAAVRSFAASAGKPQTPPRSRTRTARFAKSPIAFRRYYHSMSTGSSSAGTRGELTRGVGPWAATAVNVANMIGTGIFLKTRVMTCNVGSAKLVLLVWLTAGLLALAGTFAYSEISAMMPEAGGDYVYLRRAYGRLVGFMYGWVAFAVARAGSQAALAVGLAIFMNVALGGVLDRWHIDGHVAGLHLRIGGLSGVALLTIWVVALINCATVATGGRTALGVTLA